MADYKTEVVTGRRVIRTSNNGGTIENVLYDVTNADRCTIVADGHNPTVRNVGYKGLYRGSSFALSISGSGQCTIENVYIGDGCTQEGTSFRHGPGGMFYHKNASCDVDFINCTVRGWSNNGWYCSNSVSRGRILWDGCYGVNNGVSHFRGANPADEIRGCVAYNSSSEPYGRHSSGSERYGRCIWAWEPGPIDVYDSHIDQGSAALKGIWCTANNRPSQVNFHSGQFRGEVDTRHGGKFNRASAVGSNPSHDPPSGAPLSPEAAASGEGGGGSGPSTPDPACVRDAV